VKFIADSGDRWKDLSEGPWRRGRKMSMVFANSHRTQIARALNANNINGPAGLTVIKKREKTDVQIVRRVYTRRESDILIGEI